MNRWIALAFFMSLFLSMDTASLPSKESAPPSPPPITVEGVLRLVGNEPFTKIGVQDAQNNFYYLEAGPKDPIRFYIGRPIRVQGVLVRKQVSLADKKPLPDELTIVQYTWEPVR